MRHYAHESCHEIRAYSRVEKKGGGHVDRGYFSHSFKYREKVAPGRRKCRAEGSFFPSLIRIS